jgi:hypothetical protein
MTTVEKFILDFGARPEQGQKQPMTKKRAKNLIETRMPSRYPRKTCATLWVIVDSLRVNKAAWQDVDINDPEVITSATAHKLARKSSQHIDGFYRNEKRLREDGLISVVGTGTYGQAQYHCDLNKLEQMPVKLPKDRTAYQHAQYLKRKARAEKVEAAQ